ncbi:LOW QUALITY PROTEIN: hypothetical protein JCM24511_08075 [Saitozyma sp. JCM 24511]|nr:LOW QUALITY PROTEIN: hypothetical protein JCM24511_08075 [Saitozyma sp. JCM 24511]
MSGPIGLTTLPLFASGLDSPRSLWDTQGCQRALAPVAQIASCISYKTLRNSQHRLRSDDVEHFWKRLFDSVANSAHRIRPVTSPASLADLDDTLIVLSINVGGLGLLFFKTCAPLAYSAPFEASGVLLVPPLSHYLDTANQTVHSQRERFQEALLARRESPLESLVPRAGNRS